MTGYQLNAGGHRTRIDEATGRTRYFAYYGLNRLTSEQVTGDPPGENGTAAYANDLVGNRLSRSSTLPGVTSENASFDVNDRLDSDTYDANGSTLVAMGITAGDVYDAWNRLVRRTKSDGTTIDLGYDHAGNRVTKTVSTATNMTFTAYLVDANSLTGYAQVLEELREDGLGGLEVFRTYAVGHDVISQTTPDSSFILHTSYFLYDGQGSVWGLADENGAVTDYYLYDAFGLHLREQGAGAPNNIRFTGEQWDADLGHYYLRARYYEPSRGRFWTMDGFEGFNADPVSLHKYLYANANPVMHVDPSGKSVDTILGNLLEWSKIGQEVHKKIQREFGMKKERTVANILIDEGSLNSSNLAKLDVRLLGLLGRPDLYKQEGKYIFEIKPALQLQTGMLQIEGYLSTLNNYSKYTWHD